MNQKPRELTHSTKVEIKDYNGIVLNDKPVKAENIIVTVSIKYEGKYGEEEWGFHECTMNNWFGMDDALTGIEIEYDGELNK